MKLHQLNATYVPAEDRVALRLRTREGAEVNLWLTRRTVKDLLGQARNAAGAEAAARAAASPDPAAAAAALSAFAEEAAVAGADFATPYASGATAHPLGAEPLLVRRFELAREENGGVRVAFGMGQGNPAMSFRAPMAFAHRLRHLLSRIAGSAGWDLPEASAAPPREPGHAAPN